MQGYKLNKGMIAQDLKEKIVIFDEKNITLHTLNETAAIIFRKIVNKWTKDKITNYLVKLYSVPDTRAKKDIDSLIESLKKKKILVTVKTTKP